jgi:acetyl-CoA synthetase
MASTPNDEFRRARDLLLEHRSDYPRAFQEFRWPALDRFNWAFDHFDPMARGNTAPALWIVEEDGSEEQISFEEMAERSLQGAAYLRGLGLGRGDRVMMMLPNTPALWEVMLAVLRIGAVVAPATTQLTPADVADRVERGGMSFVITDDENVSKFDTIGSEIRRVVVGDAAAGWYPWSDARKAPAVFENDRLTQATDPLLLYFTSGTAAKPKLVLHTHQSYPVGHLSTMYWIGIQPGDIHWNISSPGWAKHAWSNVYAPWNAGATVFVQNYARFNAELVLRSLASHPVTTLCAPPTVWRMLIIDQPERYAPHLREATSAGEPLNPEVIDRIRDAWGITVRDGYGQTETTCQIGNPPGEELVPGAMGWPLPGYHVALLDADGNLANEGEISLPLEDRPTGLMVGYLDDDELTAKVMRDGYYHTGDVARRDEEGRLIYVGRADDVFKSSDYRISPFELESVLIEHDAVAEAAVVPSPDPLRTSVPKAFIALRPGIEPDAELARSIFEYTRQRLAPYKRLRCLEFIELPKTISGKIRRVELRTLEIERRNSSEHCPTEFWETDVR